LYIQSKDIQGKSTGIIISRPPSFVARSFVRSASRITTSISDILYNITKTSVNVVRAALRETDVLVARNLHLEGLSCLDIVVLLVVAAARHKKGRVARDESLAPFLTRKSVYGIQFGKKRGEEDLTWRDATEARRITRRRTHRRIIIGLRKKRKSIALVS